MSIEHLQVLAVVGWFVLGPQRPPDEAAWLGQARPKVRDFAAGAQTQLQDELGPEFKQLRRPLQNLAAPRTVHLATVVTRPPFDEDTPATTSGARRPVCPHLRCGPCRRRRVSGRLRHRRHLSRQPARNQPPQGAVSVARRLTLGSCEAGHRPDETTPCPHHASWVMVSRARGLKAEPLGGP
jgi:sec-independent protein translocase protein TatB